MLIIDRCPSCNAAVEERCKFCEFCGNPLRIQKMSAFEKLEKPSIAKFFAKYKKAATEDASDGEAQLGLGLCYLQMNNYELAEKSFDKAIESRPDLAQAYYYKCLAQIRGRRLMTLSLKEAKDILTNTETAIQFGYDAPECYLLQAMIKGDYYQQNGMRVPQPDANTILHQLSGVEFDPHEIEVLTAAVKVANIHNYI